MEKKKPGTLAKAFDTHPQTPDRLAKTQQEINSLLPPEPQYKLDSSEFQDIKTRLAQLQNRGRLNKQNQDANRPTLRRASSTNPGASAAGSGDDHPTLKRGSDSN
jgi:predicted Zn-dependent protease